MMMLLMVAMVARSTWNQWTRMEVPAAKQPKNGLGEQFHTTCKPFIRIQLKISLNGSMTGISSRWSGFLEIRENQVKVRGR